VPNQSVNIQLNGSRYVLQVQEIGGMMAATVVRDGVRLVSGSRAVAGTPILLHAHLWSLHGDFIFTSTTEGEAPYFENFGVSSFLVFSTPDEISQAVAGV
jgi:hypothetical protein